MTPYSNERSVQFGQGVNAALAEAHVTMLDAGMVAVHAMRSQWDVCAAKLSWPDSYLLHLNDFRRESLGLPALPPPPPPDPTPDQPGPPDPVVGTWDCPRNKNLADMKVRKDFVVRDRGMAYGDAWRLGQISGTPDADVAYWTEEAKFQELMERGHALGYDPPEIYYHQRLIGRGAGDPWVARFGPYAGLEDNNESRTDPTIMS